MAAGTTLDKIGPLCRTVEDCGVVLSVIAGADGHDLAVPDGVPFVWDARRADYPRRIGYVPRMLEAETNADARAGNARALATLAQLGCTMEPLELPSGDLSYFIEYVERAAAFEAFTRSGRHAGLRPRTSRYLRACALTTAVDYLPQRRDVLRAALPGRRAAGARHGLRARRRAPSARARRRRSSRPEPAGTHG